MADALEVRVTPPDASLSRLLALVEQWQGWMMAPSSVADVPPQLTLLKVDVAALRAAAQQHAKALRDSPPLNAWGDKVIAAADFIDPTEHQR